MQRIIIVTEVFYPDQTTTAHILTKIASKLREKFEVKVITGSRGYDDSYEISDNGEIDGIEIIRIKGLNLDKNSLVQRALKFLSTSIRLTEVLKNTYCQGDRVFIVTNPAPLVLGIAKLKKKLGFNLTLLVHDVFPENTIPAGLFKSPNSIVYKTILRTFGKAYASADNLIVIGRDMKDVVERKVSNYGNPRISIIENWHDDGDYSTSDTHSDSIKLLYAGNIGRVQGLEEFLDIFSTIDNSVCKCDLYGKGAQLKKIQSKIKDGTYAGIHYNGAFSKSNQYDVMSQCDLALVTLADGMYGLGVPSKTYNIMFAAKPILYIGHPDSEVGRLVSENNIGFVFDPSDKIKIQNFLSNLCLTHLPLLREMGQRAKIIAQEKYSEGVILDKYLTLFEK